MKRSVKVKFALAVGMVLGGGAAPSCSCSDDPVAAPTVVILSPSNGRILDGCDDVSATTQGIQIDIQVQVTGAQAGQQLALYLGTDATEVVAKDITGTCTGDAGAGDACVTFNGVTVPENSSNYAITVAVKGTNAANQVTVTIGAKEGLTFVSPVDGSTLTSSGDGGVGDDEDPLSPLLQKRVTVRACNIGDGQTISLAVINTAYSYDQTYTAIAAVSGSYVEATFASPIPSFPDGLNTLRASATVGQNTFTKEITVTVSGACSLTLTPASGAKLGQQADKNADAGGLQYDVVVTSGCPGTAYVWIDPSGGIPNCAAVEDGGGGATTWKGTDAGASGFTALFPDLTLSEGSHTLAACLVGTQTPDASVSTISVDITAPSITMTSPVEGVRTTSMDPTKIPTECADAGASYNIAANVSGTTGETFAVTLFRGSLPTPGTEEGDAGYETITGSAQGYNFPCVPLANGENRFRVVATDPTGNAASTYSASASPTDYVVNYDPLTPYVAISSTLAGKVYKKSDDLDPTGTPSLLELDLPYTAGSLGGRTVRLLVNGGVSQCDCSSDKSACPTTAALDCEIDGGAFSGTVRNVALPAGNHTLRLVVGSPGSANDAVYFSESVSVSVDVATPTITMTSPAPGACVSNAAPTLCFNVAAEEGRTFTVNGATGTVDDGGGVCVTSVPLVENQLNSLTASVIDVAGNDASVSIALTHDDAGPAEVLLEDGDASALPAKLTNADNATPGDGGFHYTIIISTDGGESTTSTATLRVGAFQTMGPVAIGSDGKATFADVEFAHGVNALTATVSDCAKNVASTQATVNVDLSADGGPFPVLSIASFADASAVDGLAVPAGPSHGVTFAIADAGGGEGCTVWATGPSSVSQTVGCSAAASIPLATEGTYAVFATSTTGGRSRTYTLFAYGDGGPSYAITSPQDGTVFNTDAGDIDGLADFQQTAFVALTGVEVGQSVKLTVTPDGGAPLIYTEAVEVSDGGVLFARVTLRDQTTSTLFVEAKNRLDAGASGTAISVVVDRKAPVLTFTQPTVDRILVKGDDKNSTNGTFDYDVKLAISGLESGRQVSLMKFDGTPTDGGNLLVGTQTVYDAGQSTVTFSNVALNVPDSGVVVVAVSATDVAGNAASSTIGFVINLTEPAIQWNKPLTTPAYFCSANATNPSVVPLTHQFLWILPNPSGGNIDLIQCQGAATSCKDAPCTDGGVVASNPISGASGSVSVGLDGGTFYFCGRYRTAAQNPGLTPDVRQVTVDTIAPTVAGIVCPEVDGGVINKTSTSCTVTLSDTSASGKSLSVLSTNPVQGATVGTGTVSAASVDVNLSLQTGAHVLSVVGTDNACGTGTGNTISGASMLSFTVDTAAPSCYITRPTTGYLKCADNESPAAGCTDAGQAMSYTLQATVTGAENGQVVYVRDDGGVIASAAISGGAVPNIPVQLEQGNRALTIRVADLAGNTCTSTPVNVTVDTVGPALGVTGASTTDQDLGVPGIQSDVVFSAANIDVGRAISIRASTNGGTTYSAVGSKVFDGGSPDSLQVNLSPGANKLLAYACDSIGNCTTSATYDLTVAGAGPTVSFVKPTGSTPDSCNPEVAQPLVYGGTGCGSVTPGVDGGIGTIAVSVKVSSSLTSCTDCVTLYKDGGALGTGSLSAGSVTFASLGALTLNDAEIGTFQARVVDATSDAGYSAFLNWSVDVSGPGTPVFDSPICTSQPVTLNKYSDLAPETGGLQYIFKLQTPGIENGQTLTLTGNSQGSIGTGTVVSNYVTMPLVTVNEGLQTLTASVSDMAGNPASVYCQVNVDVTAPTDVSLDASVNRRAGTVALAWTYPGDNAMSGTAQSFDIKMAPRQAVGALCPFLADDAGVIDGGTSISGFPKAPPPAGGTSGDAGITGLFLESQYCFAVEAVDDAGNRSTSTPIQTVTISTQLRQDSLGPTSGTSYGIGQNTATGDYNGDGYSDIAFADITPTDEASRKLYIHFGNDAGVQVIPTPYPYDSNLVYFGISIATAGDIDGDGFDDVLVATHKTGSGVPRTALLYYGSTNGLVYGADGGAQSGSPLRFDLPVSLSSYVTPIFAKGVGDVNGDGIPDSLIMEPSAADGGWSGQGFLWLGSRTNNSVTCQSTPSLPECKRPPVLQGNSMAYVAQSEMVTIYGQDNSTTLCGDAGAVLVRNVGRPGSGAGGIGDVNGDGKRDFYISDSILGSPAARRGWVFLGRSLDAGASLYLHNADVRIEALSSTWGDVTAFGQAVSGLGRVSGSPGAACPPTGGNPDGGCDDFAIGADERIYILYGRNSWPSEICMGADYQPLLTYSSSESDAGNVGFTIANVGDVTGDGRVDLLAGGSQNGAFLYYGTGDGGVPFGVTTGGKPDVTMLFSIGASGGTSVRDVPRWNADGYPDFFVGTTAGSGTVYVRY